MVWIHNEYRADCQRHAHFVDIRSILIVEHVVQCCHLTACISNDGELYVGVLLSIQWGSALYLRRDWPTCVSLMSLIHSSWLFSVLHERPITLTWRASHSGASLATAPSSVVHTGDGNSFNMISSNR
jgi:hypothetical protein